jgi:hypothetical protein
VFDVDRPTTWIGTLLITDFDGDGRAELFMVSPKDRTVAWTKLGTEGRMDYPKPLPTRGKPFAVAAGDLDRDGDLEVVYAFDDQRQYGVDVLTHVDRADGVGGAEQWRQTSTLIEGFESAPRDLKIVDANRDGRGDLAVFGTHEGLRILLQQQDGSFAEVSLSTGFRQGLVDGVSPSAFTSGDVNGDGSEEILVATDGYARSLKVADDGTS